jgi:hypothetical protein
LNNKRFLLFTIVLGLFARLVAIGFGLPNYECRPDEMVLISNALQFGTGDLNPHIFNYPSLYMYILFFLYGIYFVSGAAIGLFTSPNDFILSFNNDPTVFFLINRVFSAVMGTLTIYVVYELSKLVFNKKTALISALFLSLSYLHVRDSHFGVTDITVTFFILCSAFYIMKSYYSNRTRHYVLAGIFSGIASSIKYMGVFLYFPMLCSHYFHYKKYSSKMFLNKNIFLFFACSILFFLLGSPFILLDINTFIDGFMQEIENVFVKDYKALFLRGWFFHMKFTLFHGMGFTLLVSSLAGLVLFFKKSFREALVFIGFPLLFYLVSGKSYRVYVRYAIPLVPFLCITAAYFVELLGMNIKKISGANASRFFTAVLSAAILLPSSLNIVKFNSILSKKDNRLVTESWIKNHVPPGSTIAQIINDYAKPIKSSPMQYLIEKYQDRKKENSKLAHHDEKIARFEILLNDFSDYRFWTFHPETRRFTWNGKVQDSLPEYIVVSQYALENYREEIPEDLLRNRYRLIQSFEAINLEDSRNRFDQFDAFYLPYCGFSQVERPGPNLYVYRLVQ